MAQDTIEELKLLFAKKALINGKSSSPLPKLHTAAHYGIRLKYQYRYIYRYTRTRRSSQTFTSRIAGTQHLDYWGRLTKLSLMSLQRQRERYLLLHMWKILHESISNDLKIVFTSRPRTGIKAVVPSLGVAAYHQSLYDNSFAVIGPHSGTVFLVTSTGWKNLNPSKYNSHPCSGRSLTSLRSRDTQSLIPTPSWNGERIP